MKKKNLKRGHKGFEDDSNFSSGIKSSGVKSKDSKRKLSIYDDYEEDDDEFISYEKFKKKHK